MENNLKLSYDMLFQNGSENGEPGMADEEENVLTPAEVEELLQRRDREWEQRLEEERAEARETAFAEGRIAGKEEAEADLEKRLGVIEEMMSRMDNEFNMALEELKPHIAELVFEITEKVLDVPFEHPELRQRVQDEVINIVQILDDELHVKVTVSGADFEMIEHAFEAHHNIDHFTLRTDAECNPGEYIVETKKESIIKNFKKMVADFKESISFAEVDSLELPA